MRGGMKRIREEKEREVWKRGRTGEDDKGERED